MRILEFGREGAQHAGSNAHIAIRHHHQVVLRPLQHLLQAKYLGVRVRRLAGDDQMCGNVRKFTRQPLHDRDGRVGPMAQRKEDFEVWIVLLKKRAEIFFQAVVNAGEWLEDTDRGKIVEAGRTDRAIPHSRDYGQKTVNQRPGCQGTKKKRQHPLECNTLGPAALSPEEITHRTGAACWSRRARWSGSFRSHSCWPCRQRWHRTSWRHSGPSQGR